MKNLTFFKSCKNLVELKKEYRQLAKLYHPDLNSDPKCLEIMKRINLDYEIAFEYLKDIKMSGEEFINVNNHNVNDFFREVIDALLKFQDLEIEICGSWLWVGGITKPIKEELKAIGLIWRSKKKLWSWCSEDQTTKKWRKSIPMEKIRNIYGSEKIESKKSKKEKDNKRDKHLL